MPEDYIKLVQMNPTLGDFSGNTQKILSFCKDLYARSARLLLFPELALLGYAPNDLLERPELISNQNKALSKICKSIPADLGLVLGCLIKKEGQVFNGAVFVYKNKVQKTFTKTLLPTYDVFDEGRHFSSGSLKNNTFKFKNKKYLVAICEDIWAFEHKNKYPTDPFEKINSNLDGIFCLNASPFYPKKQKKRERISKKLSLRFSCPLYFCNQVGAQDELIFDGQSFISDANGKIIFRAPAFAENTSIVKKVHKKPAKMESYYKALTLGIRDYVHKSGFEKVHLGLSGGIDSGLVLALCVEALGPKNVCGIYMPGPYSSKLSAGLAQRIAQNLKCKYFECDINPSYQNFIKTFDSVFDHKEFNLVNENAQARLRALFLMAYSNKESSLLIATSNKSELCAGYSTLYGDQSGALLPLGDMLKTEIFALSEWINKQSVKEVIPKKMITRAPSAELRKNQKDSDSLPEYSSMDPLIDKLITQKKRAHNEIEKWIVNKSYQSEFKRWQAPPILKVSPHAFGIGRRMPLAHKFRSK